MECQIRAWQLSDAANLAYALNNKEVQNNLRDGIPFPYMEQDAVDFIQAMLHAEANTVFSFAITVNDKAIGSIGVFRKDNIHTCTAEMGYYLAEEFWGKGVGTCAVKKVCDYIFNHTDIIRIFAEPFAYNMASCRILEKSGFRYEGTLRSNAVKNGKILDMKIYARIKGDDVR